MMTFPKQLRHAIGYRESWTEFSPGRNWRYRLVRVWDSKRPRLAWVILNGSDADDTTTIRRSVAALVSLGRGDTAAWTSLTSTGWCPRIPGRFGATPTRSAPTTIATWPRCVPKTT